jgi:S-adenosylmethionine:tRNA ribosyltransferase-isomerase
MNKLLDFDFVLPPDLIAKYPVSNRDRSELVVIPRAKSQEPVRTRFDFIIDYLAPGDLMIFNDTKVIKAKLHLQQESGSMIECFLNSEISCGLWSGFAKPSRKLSIGQRFRFDEHEIEIEEKGELGQVTLRFILKEISVFQFCERYGQIPLPPYMKRKVAEPSDEIRYQSVYARHSGSVAAHTAGLHFTQDLLNRIQEKGVAQEFITLHIGAGTFLPVKTDDISKHFMHKEYYHLSDRVADRINATKKSGGRVIAVGTTSLRTLESVGSSGEVKPGEGYTDLFIRPGFEFKIADLLISNFHLPRSTLFMLVCAFAGYNNTFKAYDYAIEKQMRFFSYGDATLSYLQPSPKKQDKDSA